MGVDRRGIVGFVLFFLSVCLRRFWCAIVSSGILLLFHGSVRRPFLSLNAMIDSGCSYIDTAWKNRRLAEVEWPFLAHYWWRGYDVMGMMSSGSKERSEVQLVIFIETPGLTLPLCDQPRRMLLRTVYGEA